MGVVGGHGDDGPSGTDAAINDLFGVVRMRHTLSPKVSEESPVVPRKRRPTWISRAVDSNEESGGRLMRIPRTWTPLSVVVLLLRALNHECF